VTDWLAVSERLAASISSAVAGLAAVSARGEPLGRGSGGDITYRVDQVAEDIVVAELERLAASGVATRLVSEELGERTFGADPATTIVLDPIDGSLNARRGLPCFCVSIATAQGTTIGDITTALVRDIPTGEVFTARRGGGACCGGRRLGDPRPSAAWEVVLLEATVGAAPVANAASLLVAHTRRLRILGSLAVALCQVADGRADALATLTATRAVDIAAAQLVAREAGCVVALVDGSPLDAVPLDCVKRQPVIAAGDAAQAARLAALLYPDGAVAARP
jgi:myo-inositol-1(or 4)-monophosphatase